MKDNKGRCALNGWICGDEDSRQLHVQLSMQNLHLKCGRQLTHNIVLMTARNELPNHDHEVRCSSRDRRYLSWSLPSFILFYICSSFTFYTAKAAYILLSEFSICWRVKCLPSPLALYCLSMFILCGLCQFAYLLLLHVMMRLSLFETQPSHSPPL